MNGPIVIIGDTLLDRDVDGTSDRLCPDAPVPVLDEQSASDRPGGAGLAALLAAQHFARADGAHLPQVLAGAGPGRAARDVVLVTALADDPAGARLSEQLAAAGVQVYALRLAGATPEKIRLRAGGQLLLRLDRGGSGAVSGEPSEAVRAAIADAAMILVSDYGRGMARQPGVRAAIAEAAAPVVWDPHPRGPAPVAGVRLATPNETEVHQLSGTAQRGGDRIAAVTRSAQDLRQRWRAGAVAATMGADGVLLCHAGATPLVVPAPAIVDGDACGAGDRFAVTAALALAEGALVTEAVTAAVTEATHYVAGGGVRGLAESLPQPETPYPAPEQAAETPAGSGAGHATTDLAKAAELVARVRDRGGRVVATGGCFDLLHAGHIATLEAARQLGECLVVCLNSDRSVAEVKGPDRPVVNQADRRRMLAALRCVDAVVIFDEPTPEAVLSWLRPDVWVKGGDYAGNGDLPEAALVRRWGGQAVVVPYLAGRSTSTLIAAARNGHSRRETR